MTLNDFTSRLDDVVRSLEDRIDSLLRENRELKAQLFDLGVGNIDRIISERLILAKAGADEQTLLHHINDLDAATNKLRQILHNLITKKDAPT